MTSSKHFKRLVRKRAAKTGESYTAALRHLRHHPSEVRQVTSTDHQERGVLARCSFCNKSDAQVKKLVAGPGVYICEECVALCNDVIAEAIPEDDSASRRANFVERPVEELLVLLPAIAQTAAHVDADLRRWVSRVRELGCGWDRIAEALGTDEASARERFEAAR